LIRICQQPLQLINSNLVHILKNACNISNLGQSSKIAHLPLKLKLPKTMLQYAAIAFHTSLPMTTMYVVVEFNYCEPDSFSEH
jgi:hypothetical protein